MTKSKQSLPPSKLNLQTLFANGQYSQILSAYDKNPKKILDVEITYVIGALSFLGRLYEAEELYSSKLLDDEAKAASLFFLGIGYARKSKYKKARSYIKINFENHRSSSNPSLGFYAYQGVAFYLFYTGQFFRAEKYAKKSFRLSVRTGSSQNKILAQDLWAHVLLKTGKVHSGLQLMQENLELSKHLNNEAFSAAIEISILQGHAENGHRPTTIVSELQQALGELNVQDSYSRANIILELSLQLMLRGEWLKAEELLNSHAPAIFRSENRRQEILLNLRWAKLAFYRGQYIQAWQFVRSAQLRLHAASDKHLQLQILTIELDILEAQQSPEAILKKNELIQLQNRYGSSIDHNILARKTTVSTETVNTSQRGEDKIHQALAELQSSPQKALSIINELSYFTWYYKILPIQRGQPVLVFDLAPKSIGIFSSSGAYQIKLTELSFKIIQILSQRLVQKDDFVKSVWGYEYDPLRHDNMVYSAMSQLRKALGSFQDWVQTLDEGYRLRPDVSVLLAKSYFSLEAAKIQSEQPSSLPISGLNQMDLNHRQIQAMEHLRQVRFLNTKEYTKLFKTSEITASRDLASLLSKGHVIRVGSGRATHYTLAKEES